MAKLKIAFAGCGRISDLHRLGYADDPDAELYALCDPDKATIERRAAEWGVGKTYSSFEDLLADPAVDAVEILTPQLLHEEMVVAALRAGKHVSVQKPMTTSLASADRMIAAAARAGRIFKVSENYAFYPPLLLAKKLLDDGAIGEPMTARIKMMSGGSGGWAIPDSTWAWRLKEYAAGRGLNTFDHGHHMWSAAWLLLGEFDRVSAWVDQINGIVDSPAVVQWKHRGEKRYGQCEFQYGKELEVPSPYYGNDEWFDVSGSSGILVVNRCTARVKEGPVVGVYSGGAWKHYEAESDWAAGFVGSTKNFIAAILGREEPRLSGAEARHILAMDLAVAKSDRSGRTVWIDELDAAFPRLYAAGRARAERAAKDERYRLLADSEPSGAGTGALAARSAELTRALAGRFNAAAAVGLDAEIGVSLDRDGPAPEAYRISITPTGAIVEEGRLPESPLLVLRTSKALWASILSGKAHIETAYLHGKLRIDGEVAQSLRIRDIFKL
ncbi:MAG: Gfo/Idh/MocA family oxidoreductase [Spirochaetes bacterium]|nr:Gfo/Idh/MocA family oxidoreductase [Spirochaetota bacterium]MBU1080660.1 Gfo/Idh/MocA family oxidoreductase [Spirochaetota bacterium]